MELVFVLFFFQVNMCVGLY